MKSLALAIAASLTFLGSADSQNANFDVQSKPTAWGPETNGCRLSIGSPSESFRYDHAIELHTTTENVGTQAIRVEETNLMVVYRLDVRLPNGEPAPLTLEGKREKNRPVFMRVINTLKPGESEDGIVPMLNRLYDMSLLGEYTVNVYRQNVWPSENDKPFEVPSNTLKIVVRDYTAEETKAPPQQESNEK